MVLEQMGRVVDPNALRENGQRLSSEITELVTLAVATGKFTTFEAWLIVVGVVWAIGRKQGLSSSTMLARLGESFAELDRLHGRRF